MSKKLSKPMGNPWIQRGMILAIIMIVMAFFQRRFFTASNLNSVLIAICLYGTMACGMLFPVLLGGIDLSVASTAAICGCILAKTVVSGNYTSGSFLTGFLAGVAVAIIIGVLHGAMSVIFRLPAFVVTLATQYLLYGIVLWYTDSKYIFTIGDAIGGSIFEYIGKGRLFGLLPIPVLFYFITIALCAILLTQTSFGRKMYIVGGNPKAAESIGIKTKRYTYTAYIICSAFAACAGMMLVSMNAKAGSDTSRGYEGHTLMIMVVGGINLAGGEGGIEGAVFGALMVGVITNMLTLLGVASEYTTFFQGIIIIAAVSLSEITRRKSISARKYKR